MLRKATFALSEYFFKTFIRSFLRCSVKSGKGKRITDPSVIGHSSGFCTSEVLDENKLKLEEYLSGKERLFGFFVGQIMQKTKGKANPRIANGFHRCSVKNV